MEKINPKIRPVVLIILDGWGVAPPSQGNAIALTKTPVLDQLLKTYPSMTLQAAGEAVGLPWGEWGNSEVGHLSLGAGKIIWQNLPKINRAIADGDFFNNHALLNAINQVKKNDSQLHLIGLVSNGGVHSSLDHLFALLDMAKRNNISKVFIHAILDGRDAVFNSGEGFIKEVIDRCSAIGLGQIATLCGRFWAMDRDNYWDRTVKAYQAMVEGVAERYNLDPLQAITDAYKNSNFDEEFNPTVIINPQQQPVATINDNDAIVFFNFRPERSRQLTRALVLPDFSNFPRQKIAKNLLLVTMTEYEPGLPAQVAFSPDKINDSLAKIISGAGLRQFHIAETQKYAHVTFFFNGGIEAPFSGEDRLLVPSPRVSSFAQKPEMSAPEITQNIIKAIDSQQYDFIVVNFANPDMVGHTGDLAASQKAVAIVDELLGKIVINILKANCVGIITADHGNIEETIDLHSGDIDKEHSSNPVPFIIIGKNYELSPPLDQVPNLNLLTPSGVLADVAPTILKLIGLP